MITKICGIYKILNIITRDYYLGGSINIHGRWKEHCYKLRKNIHENDHFQNAWNKYGEQAFEFSVVLLCPVEKKLYFEQGLINLLKPAYNIAKNAVAPMQGRHHTVESRAKMSSARKGELNHNFGKHFSEETLVKMSEVQKGKYCTEETRAKLSEVAKGELNHNFGKHFSDEVRANMSKSHKGKSSGMLGKHQSEETRAKLSEITTLQWANKK